LRSLTLPAPAKLNLFLHITGRREDGYHLLQTIFQLLDYGDEITLALRADGEIKRIKGLESVPESSDLCVRAALLLKQHMKREYSKDVVGVDISINKVLPMGGGIGGGSSDAATILQGLNKLWGCSLTIDELANLGLQLGADVPVFVRGYSAWAEGVGEQLTPIELDEKWFLVIHPDVSVSTAEIFLDQGLTRDCEPIKIARFLKEHTVENCFENTLNVFEAVVRKKHPEVNNALDWLSNFSSARLTGSGSCLFASFDSEAKANLVLDAINHQSNDWQGFVAKGTNKSTLLEALL